MATAEAASRPHERHARKRPFAGWMKRLANLKPSSSETPGKKSSAAKKATAKNNPYPKSSTVNANTAADTAAVVASTPTTSTTTPPDLSLPTPRTPCSQASFTSAGESAASQAQALATSNKSTAPTADTRTTTFANGGGSTFSSPHASEHSLSTTLTTIQSTAPSHILNTTHTQSTPTANGAPTHFSHQFPISPPASAIPAHLAPTSQQPNSYQGATANNILTDNASILTLASSSKRRRRNSVDTNASVRALAPSSHYGGSRESLPLSVLSANPDSLYSSAPRAPANVPSLANAERASVYSASGVTAPVLSSERNSYYGTKPADGLSVRSGLLGHGRTDSISSIRATPTSPLASPRDASGPSKVNRKSFEWNQPREASDEEDTQQAKDVKEHEDKGKAKEVS